MLYTAYMAETRRTQRAMFASVTCLAGSVLPASLTGALGVQISGALGFDKSGLGFALAAFYLLSAVIAVSAGEFSDRVGPRRSLQISTVVSGACLVLIGAGARSFLLLAVLLAFGSMGMTLAGSATKVLVAREVPVHRHGTAFGMQMSAIPFAALLAGLAVPSIGLTIGWRWAFVLAAAVPVIGFLSLPSEPATAAPAPKRPGGRFSHVAFGPLLILGATAMLGAAAATTMASFFVVAGTEVGFAEGTAGLLLSAVMALVILVRVVFGSVADRHEDGHIRAVSALLLVAGAGFAIVATGSKALFPLGAFVALSFGWTWTGLLVHAVVRHYSHAPGVASGAIVAGLNSGSLVGPLVFGLVFEHGSYGIAFAVTGGWAVLAGMAALVGDRRVRTATSAAPAIA